MKHDLDFSGLMQVAYLFTHYVQTCPEQVTAISCAYLAFQSFLRSWRRK